MGQPSIRPQHKPNTSPLNKYTLGTDNLNMKERFEVLKRSVEIIQKSLCSVVWGVKKRIKGVIKVIM